VGHYSKDCPKLKLGNGASKVIALTSNLGQGECNRLIFLKGKLSKREVLCLLDTIIATNECLFMAHEEMHVPFSCHGEMHGESPIGHPIYPFISRPSIFSSHPNLNAWSQ